MPDDSGFSQLRYKVERSRWLDPMRGGYPQVPQRTTLPTATIDYAYRMLAIVGTPDIVYICLRNAGGAWGWRVSATG